MLGDGDAVLSSVEPLTPEQSATESKQGRSPSVDSMASTATSVICSSNHSDPAMDLECPYCFKDLVEEPITLLLTTGTCQHFVHSRCWKQINDAGAPPDCPRCAATVTTAIPLPDARAEPVAWFNAIDVAHKGRLKPQGIVPALIACTAANRDQLAELNLRGGSKSQSNFWGRTARTLGPQDCKALVEQLCSQQKPLKRPVVPDILKEREWFEYFDVDSAGMLTQDMAMRALLKTFRCHETTRLRAAMLSVWPDFDTEGTHAISRKSMMQQKLGLVDVALAKYSTMSADRRRHSHSPTNVKDCAQQVVDRKAPAALRKVSTICSL